MKASDIVVMLTKSSVTHHGSLLQNTSMNTRSVLIISIILWRVVVKRIGFKLWCLISRVWVWVPVVTLMSLSKTLNHDCFIKLGR